ncbi:hypothetical protein Acid345_3160 [Candidatus Koribacter versatilis Ellin345]|uniref:Uncharacterized protein n=1 Tax=Koribacter versatilis (strain Ellin345) TaxID=204669 RepID=Q1ILT9_KORVE|nr:hypothetical protein [Candidatus Koribacter versatilis]ABF42161.1 hypothetical protein Acid345_3160 [Candidatus Koribacter versatilis Ellin345]
MRPIGGRFVQTFAVVVALAALGFGQAGRKDDIAMRSSNGFLTPIPGALVRPCSTSATGTPCSPTVTVYSDSAYASAISVNGAGQFSADGQGNYHFYAKSCVKLQITDPSTGQTYEQADVCPAGPSVSAQMWLASTGGVGNSMFPWTGADAQCSATVNKRYVFGPGHYLLTGCNLGSSFTIEGIAPGGDGVAGTGAVLHYTSGGSAPISINPASVSATTNKFVIRDVAIDGTGSSNGISGTFAYASGGSATGTGNCLATSSNGGGSGGKATVAVSSGTVSGNLVIVALGASYTAAPTSWTLSLPASGAASSCSGTITTTGGAISGADGVLIGNSSGSVKSASGVFDNVLITGFSTGAGVHCVACEIVQFRSVWSKGNKYGVWLDGVGTSQINTNNDFYSLRANLNQIGVYMTQAQDTNFWGGDIEYNTKEGVKAVADSSSSVSRLALKGLRFEGNNSAQSPVTWTLSSLSCATNVLTGVTSSTHTMAVGDSIYLSGSSGSPSDYNQVGTVATVADNTHFTMSVGCSPGSASAAGSVNTAWAQASFDGSSLIQNLTIDGVRFFNTTSGNFDEWIGAVGGGFIGPSVQRNVSHSATASRGIFRSTSAARMWFPDEPSSGWVRPSLATNVCFASYDNTNVVYTYECGVTVNGILTGAGAFHLVSGSYYVNFNLASLTANRNFYMPDVDSTAVVPKTATTHQYVTALSSTGVLSQAQPAFSDISGTATTSQIGTGSPTSGYYVDGGTGAWTSLPSGQTNVLYQAGALAEIIGNAGDQTVYTAALGVIPAGKCVQAEVYLYHSVSSSGSVSYKWTLGSTTFTTTSTNSTANTQTRFALRFCNNSGVQNAQWVMGDQVFVGGTAIGTPITSTAAEDLSTSKNLLFVFNAASTEKIIPKAILVRLIQ